VRWLFRFAKPASEQNTSDAHPSYLLIKAIAQLGNTALDLIKSAGLLPSVSFYDVHDAVVGSNMNVWCGWIEIYESVGGWRANAKNDEARHIHRAKFSDGQLTMTHQKK
jgi:hypothetical protein